MTRGNISIDVVLVRHGIAVNIGEQGVRNDAERMLSKNGRVRTAQVARGLKAVGCKPETILSSPLRRAAETAQIIRDSFGGTADIRLTEALLPLIDPQEAVRAIAASGAKAVLVVGHMPGLSCLASFLLSGSGNIAVPFKKAGACGLRCLNQVAPGTACLQWALTPGMLCAIGEKTG